MVHDDVAEKIQDEYIKQPKIYINNSSLNKTKIVDYKNTENDVQNQISKRSKSQFQHYVQNKQDNLPKLNQ